MKKIQLLVTASGLVAGLSFATVPAFATPGPGGGNSPAGDMQSPQLQPKNDAPSPLPAAIPGAGSQALQTGQSVAKQQSGDPTVELFTAINGNDYASAQDAISRGADLTAQNALGESPIDLSVALNRNSITFMLLAARNDSGDDSSSSASAAASPSPAPYVRSTAPKSHTVPVKLNFAPKSQPGNDPGIPNASAGFLGFNH